MWYNLVRTETGELVSGSSSPIDVNKATVGFPVHIIETIDRVGIWNTSTLTYDPKQINKNVSYSEFKRRINSTRFATLFLASKTNPNLEALIEYVKDLEPINLKSATLVQSLEYIVSLGLEGWTQVDVDEILS